MFASPLSKFAKEINILERIVIGVLRENYTKHQNHNHSADQLTDSEVKQFSQGWLILRSAFVDNPGAKDLNYLQVLHARSSYILHYVMPNVQRWLHLYENCRLPFIKEAIKNATILDIGAGPATSALAFLIYFHNRIEGEIVFELTDYNLAILKDGKLILERFAEKLGVKVKVFITGGLNKNLPENVKEVDFVLMGNVWNESISSHEAARNRVLTQWSDSITKISKPNAKFLMMEPANRRSSRLLMGMRDFFSEDDTFHILAPCPHNTEKKPCILNRLPSRPWCHFGFNAYMTDFIRSANSYANISHDRLSYSYIVLGFQKNEVKLTARVIGGIMKLEDTMGCYLCHSSGRVVLEAEDKKTLPYSGQALVKNLKIEKIGKENRARVEEVNDSVTDLAKKTSRMKTESQRNQEHKKKEVLVKTFDKNKRFEHIKKIEEKMENQEKAFSPKRISKIKPKKEK